MTRQATCTSTGKLTIAAGLPRGNLNNSNWHSTSAIQALPLEERPYSEFITAGQYADEILRWDAKVGTVENGLTWGKETFTREWTKESFPST